MPIATSFEQLADHPVAGLQCRVQVFQHPTGARHIHLANDDAHQAFCVAFRTAPEDSTGLPHILEHLSLCGSRTYPVRDPFFLMLRRSLQTFMNAFTYPDMTAYPFASQVGKDFDNLLGVYLDAVFEPTLDRRDFAQEGWRLEPATFPVPEAGATAPWAFKGVVFNEMKGAMGDTDSLLFQALKRALLPDTCYRHNSGGDPMVIPELAYNDLVAFHQSRYGAANACFTTYGGGDPIALQAQFEPYLADHPGTALAQPDLQSPADRPRQVSVEVPLQEGQDPRDTAAIGLHWAWGDIGDLNEALLGELADRLLCGHPAAPLRLALESSGLGRSAGNSGYMAYLRNGIFSIDLEGVSPEDYERFQPLVWQTLEQIRDQGFAAAEIDAALHQVELARRSIGGDGTPFGLQLCLRALHAWNHGRDPVAALDQDAAIVHLGEQARSEGFWPAFISERFLDNPHRVLLSAAPDADYQQRLDDQEATLLAERVAGLSDDDQRELLDLAGALAERQAEKDDVSVLPELGLGDVPETMHWAEGQQVDAGLMAFSQGTNGIIHGLAACSLPPLTNDERRLLPLLNACIGHLGVADRCYQDQARLLNATCGGLHFWHQFSAAPGDLEQTSGYLFSEVRGLAHRASDFLDHPATALRQGRFDETNRISEILQEGLNHLQGRLLQSGHEIAAAAAARKLGGTAGLAFHQSGAGRIAWYRQQLDDIATLTDRLQALAMKIQDQPISLALIGDRAADGDLQKLWRQSWGAADFVEPAQLQQHHDLPAAGDRSDLAMTMASPVNYCALAIPTVPMNHPDAAALAVACQLATNRVLHSRIREQGGAYGASCSYRASTGTVSCTSYRDPRLEATFTDFADALRGLTSYEDEDDALTSAILGRIGSIDSPSSPAGEGRRRFTAMLTGFGPETVTGYRSRILATTVDDVRRVAATWLDPDRGHRAVLTNADAVDDSDWEVLDLTGGI